MPNPEAPQRWGYNVAIVIALLGGFSMIFSQEDPSLILKQAQLVLFGMAAGFAGCEAMFGTRP